MSTMSELQRALELLQNDFTDLSVEAKNSKSDGIAGQISVLFYTAQHKDVKAAAEAAQVALRQICKSSTPRQSCRQATELLDAVVMACGRTRALCMLGLAILQKLLSNDILSDSSRKKAVAMLHQISQSKAHDDEAIKLKLLQACLTLLQMPLSDDIEDTRQILALCFRMLYTRNASAVVNTASATVRQIVALIFDHAVLQLEEATHDESFGSPNHWVLPPEDGTTAAPSPTANDEVSAALDDDETGTDMTPKTAPPPVLLTSALDSTTAGDIMPPAITTALLLLKEMCLMCRGHPSDWLEIRPLSATFVLDLLSQAARTCTPLFRGIALFLETMREDVCGSVMYVVRTQLTADTEQVHVNTLRVGLHCLSVIVVNYSYLMATKTELMLNIVLDGCHNATHLAQQVLCMQAMRSICYSAPVVHFMFTTYDMKMDHKLRAIQSIVSTVADFVNTFVQTCIDNGDAESLQLLSTLWSQKMANKQLSFETELAAHASTGYGGMYIVLLGIDTINAIVESLETIVEHSLVKSGGVSEHICDSSRHSGQREHDHSEDLPIVATPPSSVGGHIENSRGRLLNSASSDTSTAVMMMRMTSDGSHISPARSTIRKDNLTTPIKGKERGSFGTEIANRIHNGSAAVEGTRRVSHESAPVIESSQSVIWTHITPTSLELSRLLVDAVWKPILDVLLDLVRCVSGEMLVVQLLRCFQMFAQSTGELGMDEPCKAYLTAICELTTYQQTIISPPKPAPNASTLAQADTQPEVPNSPSASPRKRQRQNAKDGIVLSSKNVQAFRTAFNVAHRLAERLEDSWIIVLTAVDSLDQVLCSPSTTTQHVSSGPPRSLNASMSSSVLNSDLQILSAAAQQLFACTADMSDGAVMHMMQALKTITIDAGKPVQSSRPRFFALERIVDVIVHNTLRVHMLWPLFFSHCLHLATSDNASTRTASMHCFTDATLRLLTIYCPPPTPTPPSSSLFRIQSGESYAINGDYSAPVPSSEATRERLDLESATDVEEARTRRREAALMEQSLMEALVQVFSGTGMPADVRYAAVDVGLHVLQEHGDKLSTGWSGVLTLLEDVACKELESARIVRLGHECMDLVSNDLLPAMPQGQLQRALHVEECYVKQSVDVNTCYSASLNLWRAADTVGATLRLLRSMAQSSAPASVSAPPSSGPPSLMDRLPTALSIFTTFTGSQPATAEADPMSRSMSESLSGFFDQGSRDQERGGGVISQLASILTYHDCEVLLLAIMDSAQSIALEPRPEVRTSGIKLLFDVMTRHGSELPNQEPRLWRMSFPLLVEVVANVQGDDSSVKLPHSSSHENFTVGDKGQRAMPLQVHHSRDSASKQWLETLEKALKGWSSYLRGTLRAMLHLPGFASDWSELMTMLENLGTMRYLARDTSGKKVAHAALSFFSLVIAPHAANGSLPQPLWEQSLASLNRCAASLASSNTPAHVSARTHCVRTLASVYTLAKSRFTVADYNDFIHKLSLFAYHPVSTGIGEKWPFGDVLPPVHTAVISSLDAMLPPVHAPCWQSIITFFCDHMEPPPQLLDEGTQEMTAKATPSPQLHVQTNTTDSLNSSALHGQSADESTNKSKDLSSRSTTSGIPNSSPQKGNENSLYVNTESFRRHTGASVSVEEMEQQRERSIRLVWLQEVAGRMVFVCVGVMPVNQRALHFSTLIRSLLDLMVLRWTEPQSSVGTAATQHFCSLVNEGLPSLNLSGDHRSTSQQQIWAALADSFETVLEGPRSHRLSHSTLSPIRRSTSPHVPPLPDHSSSDPELEALVLDCLAGSVLSGCRTMPEQLRFRLVSILDHGCTRSGDHRRTPGQRLSHMCLRKMFVICGRAAESSGVDSSDLEIAKITLPLLLRRCDKILRRYATHVGVGAAPCQDVTVSSPRMATTPISSPSKPSQQVAAHTLRDEVLCVLEILVAMQLAPSVVDTALPSNAGVRDVVQVSRRAAQRRSNGSLNSERGADLREQTHVLLLYNAVSECVVTPDRAVQEAVQLALKCAGECIGLGTGGWM